MKKKPVSFRDYHMAKLKDPEHSRMYMQVALEEFQIDGDRDAFLLALRDTAEAQGGLSRLSRKTKLNRQNLYKALSSHGNPKFDTVGAILNGLGFKLSLERIMQ